MGNVIIKDPLTGRDVFYSNPFRYDTKTNSWIADDVTKVTGTHFNNLLLYGQPYNPNNIYDSFFYRADLEGKILNPQIRFDQGQVIIKAFGNRVSFDSFDIVKKIKAGNYNDKLTEGTTYSLAELQSMGISVPKVVNGLDFGDHAENFTLYAADSELDYAGLKYAGVSDGFPKMEAAYIFGSVRFQISSDTKFTISNGNLIVDGKIELQNDEFKHESGALPQIISRTVHVLAGDYDPFGSVIITYQGDGVSVKLIGPH